MISNSEQQHSIHSGIVSQMNYLTTKQIAARLGVTACRVRQIAESREIKSVQMGGVLLFEKSTLARFQLRTSGRPKQKGNQ